MRRGHSGIGGWRSDNPRHFRPRGGGNQLYRCSRSYEMPDVSRFPTPGPSHRLHRPSHFNTHTEEYGSHDHQDRKAYRGSNPQQRFQDRSRYQNKNSTRQIAPFTHQTRHKENHGSYSDSNYYQDNQPAMNSMGDIDHRHLPNISQKHNISNQQHTSAVWKNVLPVNRQYYENRSPQKNYRHHEQLETPKIPPLDYPGHRPPASDYYGGTPTVMTNNNNTAFSRSVDDTVDIVRKRLMNRNEPHISPGGHLPCETHVEPTSESSSYHNMQSDQPPKRKAITPKPTVKSNCDKMKNKIVHQLFKMDKDKIHKLMDNPNSSTKFEYAISSLITESQNSLNRHLRSIAEKSLCSSSEDFINNDNNTIYEDTFMKQMQCILDPQDTVLLEDIKPLVMAELTKVLQLEDIDQTLTMPVIQSPGLHNFKSEKTEYPCSETYNYEEYSQDNIYDENQLDNSNELDENVPCDKINSSYECTSTHHLDKKSLLEMQHAKKINDQERKRSSDSRQSRKSIDNKALIDDIYNVSQDAAGLFNINCEQMSEEDDPFDELDKQYHVAVDPNFIEADFECDMQSTQGTKSTDIQNDKTEKNNSFDALDEIFIGLRNERTKKMSSEQEKQRSSRKSSENISKSDADSKPDMPETIGLDKKEPDKPISSTEITKSSTNFRKRSIDQKPSHRKEKRKKSESSPSDCNKIVPNKNNCPKVNDQAIKNNEICDDSAKSGFNLLFSKNQNNKDAIKESQKVDSVDKGYSDKYVKRKESRRKSEGNDKSKNKKRTSSTSSHPTLSPKENIASSGQTPTQEAKIKLKTIDMFMKKPKTINFHQAHRNTAPVPSPVKNVDPNKTKPQIVNSNIKDLGKGTKRFQSKETQTLESKAATSRFCQTEKKKFVVKCIQTEPVTIERPKVKSMDALERMKEIDLEIQVLLQEKFQLYSSIESRDSSSSTMENLGMTVLNVALDEAKEDEHCLENVLSGDAIVDDFTSIPVEELEQIALETVQEEENVGRYEKRTRRLTQKLLDQQRSSVSPTTSKRTNKKAKTPNISILEQIITDDRPLEDIIVLDELETTPARTTRRKQSRTQQVAKRKMTPRTKPTKRELDVSSFSLKDCSVILNRDDITQYINLSSPAHTEESVISENIVELEVTLEPETTEEEEDTQQSTIVVEDNVVNDIQFDMLDVSEDIVIGDNSENNSQDKDISERIEVPISEDIILQNSQLSSDDVYITEAAQGEPECKMYDYSTDENLRRDTVTVTGNGDAVLAIECIENNFIAACLDGNVYHFSGDGQLINTLRGSNLAVTCLTIVKETYGTTVYTGSLDSRIRYYDLDTGVEKGPECNVLSPIQTMDRAWDTVFVGTRTGFVLQFECKNNMLIPVSTVKFSDQSILALRAMKEGPRKVLLVAARSENVTVKDAQTGLLLRTLEGPKMTVYTLLFEDGKVYCGTSSHQIFVFDYVTGSHVGSHEGGKGAVCLRATGGLVFAGCYDGCVYVYREGETRPLAQLRGPSLMLLSLAVVGSKIIAGYKDRGLYIWKIPLSILQEMIL